MTWICQGKVRGEICGRVVPDAHVSRSLVLGLGLARCFRCSSGKLAPVRRTVDRTDQRVDDRPTSSGASIEADSSGGQARHTDPPTSKEAAVRVRTGSARAALLEAHAGHPDGLTDEEAAGLANLSLRSEYATRCSELMRSGYLRDTGRTRAGESGMQREVREITEAGWKALKIATR